MVEAPPSLGRGPVSRKLRLARAARKRRGPRPPPVQLPLVSFRTSPEIRLLIFEGAKLQRRSVTKFLEQLVVDWHSRGVVP